MIIINSPGNHTPYPCLTHTKWEGCHLADLIFPFFIVIVGISTVLGLARFKKEDKLVLYGKIIKRSFVLFFIGLLLNAFPIPMEFATLRILGVLQRIALCYFFSALLFLTTKKNTQIFVVITLLLSYWVLLSTYPSASPLAMENNLAGYLDRLLFSSAHLYTASFDPEGLLSTLPALASALLGNLLGYCLISPRSARQKLQWIIMVGLLLVALGYFWSFFFPLNKSLWSSSYVLWSAGWAFLVFAFCYGLIELKHWQHWGKPFALFGKKALLVYILHVFFLKVQTLILIFNSQGVLVNLRLYITEVCFKQFNPQNASFMYALIYTIFWWLLLFGLSKRSKKLVINT